MGVIFAVLLSAASTCPHVGANGDPAVASLIEEASRASATFRQLVAVIDGANRRDPHRILRILLDLHHELSQLIAALGHELQREGLASRVRRTQP